MKILVVDDEPIIRTGIATSIEWNALGFEPPQLAANGRAALEQIAQAAPDIVLTDIRMPVMDGLELARQIRATWPDIRVIILTGYDDFSYAQQAIAHRVSAFVLKPFGAESLIETVGKLADEIRKERAVREEALVRSRLMAENLPLIRAGCFDHLIAGEGAEPGGRSALETLRQVGVALDGPCYQVFLLAIDGYLDTVGNLPPASRETLMDSLRALMEEAIGHHANGYLVRRDMGLFLCILNRHAGEMPVEDLCRYLQTLASTHLHLSISVGIGAETGSLSGIPTSYAEALEALGSRFFRGGRSILAIREARGGGRQEGRIGFMQAVAEEKELLQAIREMDRARISGILASLFDQLAANRLSDGGVRTLALRMLMAAVRELEKQGVAIEGHLELQKDPFREIGRLETAMAIRDWLGTVLGSLVDIMEKEKTDTYKSVVKLAIVFIQSHFSEDLPLARVAEHVHVTPAYFSRIFKEETGVNFLEWLNRQRIEQARSLLADPARKTYEVAEMVGFHDYKHFSSNFRRYVGCTLSEYRERIRKPS